MRPFVVIALFLVFMQAGAVAMQASGAADAMGIDPQVGENDKLDTAESEARDVSPGGGGTATLFGLIAGVSGVVDSIIDAIYPAAGMMRTAGLPGWFVTYMFSGLSILMGADFIGFLRGYRLT